MQGSEIWCLTDLCPKEIPKITLLSILKLIWITRVDFLLFLSCIFFCGDHWESYWRLQNIAALNSVG